MLQKLLLGMNADEIDLAPVSKLKIFEILAGTIIKFLQFAKVVEADSITDSEKQIELLKKGKEILSRYITQFSIKS